MSAVMIKGWQPGDPPCIIRLKRGGRGSTVTGNNGPTGWKARPGPRMHRALAEMAISYGVFCGQKRIPGAGPNNGLPVARKMITR